MRLIDVDKLDWWYKGRPIRRVIDEAPTIDAVPVVRCGECKRCDPETGHCDHPMGTTLPLARKPDDFCSYGERKEAVHTIPVNDLYDEDGGDVIKEKEPEG